MYFVLKLALLILIILSEVHNLSAATLVERTKTVINDQNNFNSNYNGNSSNEFVIHNDNNEPSLPSPIPAPVPMPTSTAATSSLLPSPSPMLSLSSSNGVEEFYLQLLVNDSSYQNIVTDNAQPLQKNDNTNSYNNNSDKVNKNTTTDNHQRLSTSQINQISLHAQQQKLILPTNLNDQIHSHNNNANNYFHYKLLQSENGEHISNTTDAHIIHDIITSNNTVKIKKILTKPTKATTSKPVAAVPHLVDNPKFSYVESTTKKPTTAMSSTTSSTSTTSTELPISDSDVKETSGAADISSNWLNAINTNDMEHILLKYETNNNSSCLMDDIKDVFMWWSYNNGSLRTDAFNFKSNGEYLDMSYMNMGDDDNLYSKTRVTTFKEGDSNVFAFSAAHNNLTHAPFRTLSIFSDTLLYLTLQGNQFIAYSTTDKEKQVITEYIKNVTRYNNQDANNSTEDNEDWFEFDAPETLTLVYKDLKKLYDINPAKLFGETEDGIAWATFPLLPNLLELDISNCRIEYVTRDAFKNITNLRRLFMSHNKMLTIPHDTFHLVPRLQYLDLSYINALGFDYQIPLPTLEAIIHLIYGVKIQAATFKNLTELMFLDLSHTKLTRNSAMAFTHLGSNMKYMSLCYTAFPIIGNALFKNTGLVGLDLSGNPYAAYNLIEDAFEGIADTLQYLYFQQSNVKDLNWLRYLKKLRVLNLASNNINAVTTDTFESLSNLQVLDLSSNHVGNWYNSAFAHNKELRVLNLRDNNINIINLEMLKDFQLLDYLSLGENNFVCDCLLRDLVDIAADNNKQANCKDGGMRQDVQTYVRKNWKIMSDFIIANETKYFPFDYRKLWNNMNSNSGGKGTRSSNEAESDDEIMLPQLLMKRYHAPLQQSYNNLLHYSMARNNRKLRVAARGFYDALRRDSSTASEQCGTTSAVANDRVNGSAFKFQLLDYEDDHYWCFNETERMHFVQLDCKMLTYADNLAGKLHKITTIVVAIVCSMLGVSLLGIILYLRRWHIHYYYSSLKSASLMSVATKEQVNKFNELVEQDPNLVYDLFISYCQNDREWVLNELLPNVEEAGNVSICLHERDFQIGVAILDNIISCMDRSRALMLIISSNFLLSHWCQFEMHLAQHRIFEVSKEHLIIVFLEDIPRSKRPKTLQYLMEVKTYIKWPGAKGKPVKQEERKLFWKRLQRSLEQLGVAPPQQSPA